jgi:hypothetical protein
MVPLFRSFLSVFDKNPACIPIGSVIFLAPGVVPADVKTDFYGSIDGILPGQIYVLRIPWAIEF